MSLGSVSNSIGIGLSLGPRPSFGLFNVNTPYWCVTIHRTFCIRFALYCPHLDGGWGVLHPSRRARGFQMGGGDPIQDVASGWGLVPLPPSRLNGGTSSPGWHSDRFAVSRRRTFLLLVLFSTSLRERMRTMRCSIITTPPPDQATQETLWGITILAPTSRPSIEITTENATKTAQRRTEAGGGTGEWFNKEDITPSKH